MYHEATFSLYLPFNLYFIHKQNKQFHVLFHYFGKFLPVHLLIWEIVNLNLVCRRRDSKSFRWLLSPSVISLLVTSLSKKPCSLLNNQILLSHSSLTGPFPYIIAKIFCATLMDQSLERLRFTYTATVRFKLRISQNRKWADENSSKQFLWMDKKLRETTNLRVE